MTDRELLEQALEALELRCGTNAHERDELIPALRKRLEQPEPDDIKRLRDELLETLDKLARLGNEPHYGNSVGNDIAKAALAKLGAGK